MDGHQDSNIHQAFQGQMDVDYHINNLYNQLKAKDLQIDNLKRMVEEKTNEKDIAQVQLAFFRECWTDQKNKADALEKEVQRLSGRTSFWLGQVSHPASAPVTASQWNPSSGPSFGSSTPTIPVPPPLKKRQYRKVIPFAQQVFTNSLEAASPVGSFAAAVGRWSTWTEKDRVVAGIDLKDFFFHMDKEHNVPQEVKKAPASGVDLFKLRNPTMSEAVAENLYQQLTRMEKREIRKDLRFLQKWQQIMVEQGMVKIEDSGANGGGLQRKRDD